jgi:hypothetical protein
MTLLVALLCLALGIALGWFGHRLKVRGVGAPTPKPLRIGPTLDEQAHRAAVLATRAVEHAEWDAEWRKLTPPSAGVVWQRNPTGHLTKWPEFGYSPKGTKITDFNN